MITIATFQETETETETPLTITTVRTRAMAILEKEKKSSETANYVKKGEEGEEVSRTAWTTICSQLYRTAVL